MDAGLDLAPKAETGDTNDAKAPATEGGPAAPPNAGTEEALSAEEEAFLKEEDRLLKVLDESCYNYLLADLGVTDPKPEDLQASKANYKRDLIALMLHKCTYELAMGDHSYGTRTKGEKLFEIINSTIIHDRQRRLHFCDQIDASRKPLRHWLEQKPYFRYGVTVVLGGVAIAGAHTGLLPESYNPYFEYAGEAAEALAHGLAGYTFLRKRGRRKYSEAALKELDQQEAAMASNPHALERYVGFLSDYVSQPHHDYFMDKLREMQSPDDIAKILDELEDTVNVHAAHHDVSEMARLVKLYYEQMVADGGLLQQLEERPSQTTSYEAIILEILEEELRRDSEKRHRDGGLYKAICAAVGVTVGAAVGAGGVEIKFHPIDSPLGERDKEDEEEG